MRVVLLWKENPSTTPSTHIYLSTQSVRRRRIDRRIGGFKVRFVMLHVNQEGPFAFLVGDRRMWYLPVCCALPVLTNNRHATGQTDASPEKTQANDACANPKPALVGIKVAGYSLCLPEDKDFTSIWFRSSGYLHRNEHRSKTRKLDWAHQHPGLTYLEELAFAGACLWLI